MLCGNAGGPLIGGSTYLSPLLYGNVRGPLIGGVCEGSFVMC